MDKLLQLIDGSRHEFSDEFVDWLVKNEHIWNAFVGEAAAIYRRGFRHYSARTIIHVLRHHSAVHENGTKWKISDHSSPYLARLFDLRYPEMSGLWSFKKCMTAATDARLRDLNLDLDFGEQK